MKAKDKPCSFCPRVAPLYRSYPATCHYCARQQATSAAIAKSKEGGYKQVTLSQSSQKVAKVFKVYRTKEHKRTKSPTAEKIKQKADINEFFDNQALQVPERCENCNLRLNAFAMWQKRFVTAHILPKSLFPSVAAHPDNRMFLGVSLFSECSCHPNFDNSDADHRKTMPVYKIALARVEGFYDLLTPHEQVRFEKYFGINIQNKVEIFD